MDAWNPPKKWVYDLVENVLNGLAMLAMFAGLLLTVCIAA